VLIWRLPAGHRKMKDYRLYCLSESGKIRSAEWINAKTDEEAVVLARMLKLPVHCELWDGIRLVALIPPRVSA
jgi:hypothetical protein